MHKELPAEFDSKAAQSDPICSRTRCPLKIRFDAPLFRTDGCLGPCTGRRVWAVSGPGSKWVKSLSRTKSVEGGGVTSLKHMGLIGAPAWRVLPESH